MYRAAFQSREEMQRSNEKRQKMENEKLYIVMPAYNEEATIADVVRDWYPVVQNLGADSRIVVADSGSNDRTHSILLDLQKEYPQIEILSDTGKFHGPKVIALYRYAIEQNAEWIFQTDSDGQTVPSEFSSFWDMRQKYDIVCGKRAKRGDGLIRALVEKVVCILLRAYFKVKVPDANAPFRLMKTDTVKKYLEKLSPEYNLPNIMLTTFFVYYKEKILFLPITFRPRQGGKNSIDLVKIVKIGCNALKDFAVFKKNMNDTHGEKPWGT